LQHNKPIPIIISALLTGSVETLSSGPNSVNTRIRTVTLARTAQGIWWHWKTTRKVASKKFLFFVKKRWIAYIVVSSNIWKAQTSRPYTPTNWHNNKNVTQEV